MKLSLVVLTPGKQQGKALPITLPQFLIGRDPQCHLRPASETISKRHCALLVRDGKVYVRDFDSTNGTFVNDQPVKGEAEVRHDDRLKIGPLEFSVLIETTPAVNRPTPPPPTRKTPAGQQLARKPEGEAAPKPAGSGTEDDESVAAMLLSLQDDSDSGKIDLGGGEVPEGSTVMDVQVPPELEGSTPAEGKDADKPKPPSGNTSNAAKAILDKYMRRPRG